MMTSSTRRQPLAQWIIIIFLIGVVGVGMWFARNDPDTPWGPIILGAFGLLGLVVRNIFRVSDHEDDGYGHH